MIYHFSFFSPEGDTPDYLQAVNVPAVSKETAVNVPAVSKETCLASYPGDINDDQVCAGLAEGGKDSCQVS